MGLKSRCSRCNILYRRLYRENQVLGHASCWQNSVAWDPSSEASITFVVSAWGYYHLLEATHILKVPLIFKPSNWREVLPLSLFSCFLFCLNTLTSARERSLFWWIHMIRLHPLRWYRILSSFKVFKFNGLYLYLILLYVLFS